MTNPFNPDIQATGESPVIGRSLLLNAERDGKPLNRWKHRELLVFLSRWVSHFATAVKGEAKLTRAIIPVLAGMASNALAGIIAVVVVVC